jgi:hypothetical protein
VAVALSVIGAETRAAPDPLEPESVPPDLAKLLYPFTFLEHDLPIG